MTLVLCKNRKFFLQPINNRPYDIESLVPIQPKPNYMLYDVWQRIMRPQLENIVDFIHSHVSSFRANGYMVCMNRIKLYDNLCKYIYEISTNKRKKYNENNKYLKQS